MTALNTIPTAAEDSALAPKKDTTTKLKGLVAGAALATTTTTASTQTLRCGTATAMATTRFRWTRIVSPCSSIAWSLARIS